MEKQIMSCESATIARCWVLAMGYDCDGYNGGHVYPFATRADAKGFADELNEWSDGIEYKVTDDWRSMMEYCERHGKDYGNYLDVI